VEPTRSAFRSHSTRAWLAICHGYEDFVATEERVEHMKTLTRTSHDCASEVVASILKGDAQPWP